MSEAFLGEIRMFAGNFPPRGWLLCNGQTMSIQQNTALFSLLGTTYGGNGTSTFALPDYRGRVPVHQGQGPGLAAISLGEMGGTEHEVLIGNQIPSHTHLVGASTGAPPSSATTGYDVTAGTAYVPGSTGAKPRLYGPAGSATAMSANAIAPTGNNVAHNNMAPFQALTFIIATQGIYPSRN